MDTRDLLTDAVGRIGDGVHRLLAGADERLLTFRPDPEANTIAWLVWHLTRGQDAQIADAYDTEQVWTAEGWADRFALPFSPGVTGYGQSSDEVAAVRVPADLLLGYYDATQKATLALLASTTENELDRVVDTRWDPPVTLGIRLISIVDDDVKHLGQAEYVKGMARRATP
ncbi:mycothiol transferase [Rathayibacter sp. KR2-224]|uniref:mycothiol transferase n=1 Tax=Rathayibacter sp. KR2-224 TaxID=3400913 RepID=UPI003C01C0D4